MRISDWSSDVCSSDLLKPELDAGVIGLSSDGFVAVREPDRVPFADRPRLRALVANENADRSALYRQIAVSNGEPGWQTPLRDVFAQRWIVRAAPSWRSEEHTSELQSLMRISYAGFCLTKK